mmetsp:Transcript_113151/g.330730  ORF Transcript_113151/g.330730 Transcript_113151/m.330730 type:complete len:204 (+) Transcript_113151:1259-1870(+)
MRNIGAELLGQLRGRGQIADHIKCLPSIFADLRQCFLERFLGSRLIVNLALLRAKRLEAVVDAAGDGLKLVQGFLGTLPPLLELAQGLALGKRVVQVEETFDVHPALEDIAVVLLQLQELGQAERRSAQHEESHMCGPEICIGHGDHLFRLHQQARICCECRCRAFWLDGVLAWRDWHDLKPTLVEMLVVVENKGHACHEGAP